MTVYIDQSGKVEDTRQVTVVAFANGHSRSIRIGAREKQKLVRMMRGLDFPKKTFIFKIFAGLIFLLLKKQRFDQVKIDREYPGNEATIKNILLQLFLKFSLREPDVSFVLVGKDNLAHKIALGTFQKKMKPNVKVKANDLLVLFYHKKELETSLKAG